MLSGSRTDAEDALQDVFLRAYHALRADDRPVDAAGVAVPRRPQPLHRPAAPPDPGPRGHLRPQPHGAMSDPARRGRAAREPAPPRRRRAPPARAAALRPAHARDGGPLLRRPRRRARRHGARRQVAARPRADRPRRGGRGPRHRLREIRDDLVAAHDSGVRASGRARKHLRECSGCREYRGSLRGRREGLSGAALPATGRSRRCQAPRPRRRGWRRCGRPAARPRSAAAPSAPARPRRSSRSSAARRSSAAGGAEVEHASRATANARARRRRRAVRAQRRSAPAPPAAVKPEPAAIAAPCARSAPRRARRRPPPSRLPRPRRLRSTRDDRRPARRRSRNRPVGTAAAPKRRRGRSSRPRVGVIAPDEPATEEPATPRRRRQLGDTRPPRVRTRGATVRRSSRSPPRPAVDVGRHRALPRDTRPRRALRPPRRSAPGSSPSSPSTRPSAARRSAAAGCGPTTTPAPRSATRCACSEAMTYKSAVAGLPLGGGKGVIVLPPGEPLDDERRRAAALLDFGETVERLGGSYITAEDVGTSANVDDDDRPGDGARQRAVAPARRQSATRARSPRSACVHAIEATLRADVRQRAPARAQRRGRRARPRRPAPGQAAGQGRRDAPRRRHRPARKADADALGARWVDAGQGDDRPGRRPRPLRARRRARPRHRPGAAGRRRSRARPTTSSPAAEIADLLRERGILWAPDFVANAGGIVNISRRARARGLRPGARDRPRPASIGDTLRAIFDAADARRARPRSTRRWRWPASGSAPLR